MKEKITLGLLGFGTVGSKVFELFTANKKLIEEKVGADIEFVYCCDIDSDKIPKNLVGKRCTLTYDWQKVVYDPIVDIVVELIGKKELANKIIIESLKNAKHVVTANKAVLAENWHEIFSVARFNQKLVYFEASVGAGIPVIQALNEGLAANKINKVIGILNGTTNYILTKMLEEKISFESALKQVQKEGFAEADPKLDIEGIDTSHKLSILSSIAWSSWIKPKDMYVEGITDIDLIDIRYAYDEFGYVIRLLGIAKKINNKILLEVRPCLISNTHPFASVKNEYNAILVEGDACGDIIFYGKGAGGYPAASAIVSDIMFLARQIAIGMAGRVPYVTYDPNKKVEIIFDKDKEGCYYLRFTTLDEPGVLAQISGILGKNKVSIANVYQKESPKTKNLNVPIILTTHRTKEKAVRKSIQEIDKLKTIKARTVLLKIEQ